MDKQELIEKLREHGAWCTECHDINGKKDRYVKSAKVRELLDQLDEPQVTNEQAWNKIAESYPETAQNLRITLDHAVYGHETEPQKAVAQLAEKWHEDIGPVLWWNFPVEEPPYCGTPLDEHFPKYKTHFTELHIPDEVEEESKYIVPVPNLSKEFFYTADGQHISFCQRKNIDDVKSKVKFTLKEVKRLFPKLVDTVEKVEV